METAVDPSNVIQEKNILSMLFSSGPIVQAVLIILIMLSVWSWAISISKYLQLKRAKKDSEEFTRIFWESKNLSRVDDSSRRLEGSPLSGVFISGYREVLRLIQNKDERIVDTKGFVDLSTVESALNRAEIQESQKLEKGVVFLATVASSAPFIGLFGTVWGIMNAFHGLTAAKSTTIQAVAPGISEALVATAVGLAAAIPAAIAYNYFSSTIKSFRHSIHAFKNEFINVAKLSFFK